jgi:hypothetical protein
MRGHTRRTRLTRELRQLTQERFSSCDICRPDDSYDWIEEVVNPLRLRKRERKRLFRVLTCPECESRVEEGTLVTGASRSELSFMALSRKFDQLYKADLEDFRAFLTKHPMLGADHPFGKLLAQAVRRARKMRLEPKLWFRATKNLSEIALGPRPRERTTRAYRFNQIGQVAWYLGTDLKTAAVEVLREPRAKTPFAVASVNLLDEIPILDLRTPFRYPMSDTNPTRSWILREVVARRFIAEPTHELDESRPQYRIPQYVADVARKCGFRGILYDSTRPSAYNNPEAQGTNLVLFDPPPPHFEINNAEVMEFGELDPKFFSVERWPVRLTKRGD